MSSVKKVLRDKENIVFQTGKHWIVFSPMLTCFFLTFLIDHFYSSPLMLGIALVFSSWTCFLACIDFCFSSYVMTSQGIVMKEGLFWRRVLELELSAVAKSELEQSMLGAWLGYGQLMIYSFGGSHRFSNICKPKLFQEHLHYALGKKHVN